MLTLIELMDALDLNQTELSAATGVAQPKISQYLSGTQQMSLPTANRIAKGTGSTLTVCEGEFRFVLAKATRRATR